MAPSQPTTRKLRLGVLISGRGSNLQALIDATKASDFPAEIALVVSNKANAAGLERAADADIDTATISHKDYPDRTAFDQAMTQALQHSGCELICLAGFMRILSSQFVDRWSGRLINIHPSLLPDYKGLNVHERMVSDGIKTAGCTVHYVTEDMDAGPIIGQRSAPLQAHDTADTLASRILVEEHILYPACVRMIAEAKTHHPLGALEKPVLGH